MYLQRGNDRLNSWGGPAPTVKAHVGRARSAGPPAVGQKQPSAIADCIVNQDARPQPLIDGTALHRLVQMPAEGRLRSRFRPGIRVVMPSSAGPYLARSRLPGLSAQAPVVRSPDPSPPYFTRARSSVQIESGRRLDRESRGVLLAAATDRGLGRACGRASRLRAKRGHRDSVC